MKNRGERLSALYVFHSETSKFYSKMVEQPGIQLRNSIWLPFVEEEWISARKCCETEAGCSSLPEKTTKSNCLQMSLQRQHFLLSYFTTLSVGPAGVWTRDLAPAQQTDTLPTELIRRLFTRRITWGFIHVCTLLFIFLIPVEAGVCPNEENKKWKIENCDECYCRNTIVYCPTSCV